MAAQDQRNDDFLRGLFDAYLQRARGLSEYLLPGSGGKKMTDEEVRLAWNERAMSVEDEWALWRARNEDGTPMYTPEQIGLQVFPRREKIAKSGGRVTPVEFVRWTNTYAKTQQRKHEQTPAPAEGMTSDGIGIVADQ